MLPRERRLPEEELKEAEKLVSLQVNNKLMRDHLQDKTGKKVILKDISNIISKVNASKKSDNIESLVSKLKKTGSVVEVFHDFNNQVQGVFYQDEEMQKIFSAYCDIVFVDATYKLNDLRMPLYVIMIEDSLGQSEVAAICLLNSEEKPVLQHLIKCFQKHNPDSSGIKRIKKYKKAFFVAQKLAAACSAVGMKKFMSRIKLLTEIEELWKNNHTVEVEESCTASTAKAEPVFALDIDKQVPVYIDEVHAVSNESTVEADSCFILEGQTIVPENASVQCIDIVLEEHTTFPENTGVECIDISVPTTSHRANSIASVYNDDLSIAVQEFIHTIADQSAALCAEKGTCRIDGDEVKNCLEELLPSAEMLLNLNNQAAAKQYFTEEGWLTVESILRILEGKKTSRKNCSPTKGIESEGNNRKRKRDVPDLENNICNDKDDTITFFPNVMETMQSLRGEIIDFIKNEWLPLGCVEQSTQKLDYCSMNITQLLTDNKACRCFLNVTDSILSDQGFNCTNVTYQGDVPVPVAQLYFDKTVINKADDFYPDTGNPQWKLALCLLLSWIVVVLCLVVYFTATFPYVILLILLIRGATLDGAIDGVKYFLIPEWSKLADLKVWIAAAGQMFFSLSVSFGGIIMFGSYNKFSNNVYGDALLIAVMDLVTSIIAGFVIFTTFGALAKKTGLEVSEVARGGYGLAFVAYPEALSNLPLPQLGSVLFFFMLFTLGLDSEVR
ncbi:Hypothetical predicted protein [Mytilus galloprovincialis]|uniref:ZSWIM1/3 RNaseH-like domain-containing protein n=1 Tax=Mytilus galloprovincialis TaxID=29158 RepID=A0A8B6GTF4_MYTGA|nr:Hypothetical predicted protein [Mytilus galloprovincialis]